MRKKTETLRDVRDEVVQEHFIDLPVAIRAPLAIVEATDSMPRAENSASSARPGCTSASGLSNMLMQTLIWFASTVQVSVLGQHHAFNIQLGFSDTLRAQIRTGASIIA